MSVLYAQNTVYFINLHLRIYTDVVVKNVA